jgi:hypothetical protein
MVNIKKQIVPLTLVIFVLGCAHLKGEIGNMPINKDRAIEISSAEAKALGFNVSVMEINIDENNTLWKRYSSSLNVSTGSTILDEMPEVKSKLKGRAFWVVLFLPRGYEHHDGDLWVFVDKNTGEIILHLKGQ